MFLPSEYELLDFGDGRKLERFGQVILDRPSPPAEFFRPANPQLWQTATARYHRTTGESGTWTSKLGSPVTALPSRWTIAHDGLQFALKPTDFGHIGIFPEQQSNWDWLAQQIQAAARPLKILNLFAYTGGSTLACAAAGASVVHVDAAKNVVDWARENAALSGLSSAPVRWIAEDALKFVRREVRRENQYDAIILDPPSYGHGPKGEVWKIDDQLPELLNLCGKLTARQPQFLLATCHSANWDADTLQSELRQHCLKQTQTTNFLIESSTLSISTPSERKLPCGIFARVSRSINHRANEQ